jgi:hypothetical protein
MEEYWFPLSYGQFLPPPFFCFEWLDPAGRLGLNASRALNEWRDGLHCAL